MINKFEVSAETRSVQGKSASRRLRREGKLPGVLYGGGKEPTSLQLNHTELMLQSDNEAFYSHILTLKVAGVGDEQVVVKAMQRHPVRPAILHVDFLRVSDDSPLTMRIPVHFRNGDVCPAVKSGGGTVQYYTHEVEVMCLPKHLPEYIEVDMMPVAVGQTLHLADLNLPEGVQIALIAKVVDNQTNLPVVTIHPPKVVEETPAAAAKAAKGKGKK